MTHIINYLLKSNNAALYRFGNTLNIRNKMIVSRDSLITESFENGSKNNNINIYREIHNMIKGKYAGNKEYLFKRISYLADQGIRHNTVSDQKITVERVVAKKLPKRNKKGQFIAARRKYTKRKPRRS